MLQQSFLIPIIKVTDSCNFNCEFCYYAQKKTKSRLMTEVECKNIIRLCFEYNVKQHNKRMRIIFHGGEPLLQPIGFYKEMVAYEKELAQTQKDFIFLNSIQTNGYLLNDELIDFFKNEEFNVGISIDGGVSLNCHFGESGVVESTKTVLKNIAKLNAAGVDFGIISVITNKHTLFPSELYHFCVENGIHDLSLNYCYDQNEKNTVSNEKLIPFVKTLFDLYANGDYELNVREFNEIIAKCTGYNTDTCAMCDRCNCGQYLSFDVDGNVFFCDTGYDKSTAIGNIKTHTLYEIVDSYSYLKKLWECRSVYEKYCLNCEVKDICGGGCHRYDIRGTDSFLNNYFCPTHKELTRHISDYVKNILSNNEK